MNDDFFPVKTIKIDITPYRRPDGSIAPITLHLKPYHVVIIHPSLGCPAVAEPDRPVELFLLTEEAFYRDYQKDTQVGNPHPGQGIKRTVSRFLKVQPWSDAVANKTGPTEADRPIYDSLEDAFAGVSCTYVGGAGEFLHRETAHGRVPFGVVRQQTLDYYNERLPAERALGHVFQVTLDGLNLTPGTLHDVSWITYDEHAPDNPFLERQDQFTQAFLQGDEGAEPLRQAYSVGEHGIAFTPDVNRPIQSFHPVWVAPREKERLSAGHLTDVHVSSRQHAFTKSRAQLIPGAPDADSPALGSLVNVTFESLKDLMEQFGEDDAIDVLFITGDLVDYGRNYDPAAGDITNTAAIWAEMDHKHHKDDTKYPRAIDNVALYSLILYYTTQYQKPVFLTSGNHDAYSDPYGISPRVGPERANPGIPADHNLTIPEAILLYGPDYGYTGGTFKRALESNFDAQNFDWFYAVFTPLSDYYFTYKEQCFIGLEWGDKEDFTGATLLDRQVAPAKLTGGLGGGFLPRAEGSLNARQLTLLRNATGLEPSQYLLFTHFTCINYALATTLDGEGEVHFERLLREYGDYDHGTFEERRDIFYRDYLARGVFDYTFSGHSHRSGLYACTGVDGSRITTQGYDPECTPINAVNGKTKVIVSACGGPIATQNYAGELAGLGLDAPSGTWVKFEGGKETIGLNRPKKYPQAKPRFAVALDYFDILHREKTEKGVFTRFESEYDSGPFNIELNADLKIPNVAFIEAISLFVCKSGLTREVPFNKPQKVGERRFRVTRKPEDRTKPKLTIFEFIETFVSDDNALLFLVLRFNEALAQYDGFGAYNYDSPWAFQVEVIARKQLVEERYGHMLRGVAASKDKRDLLLDMHHDMAKVKGYLIRRHPDYSEVPEHEHWVDLEPDEFSR